MPSPAMSDSRKQVEKRWTPLLVKDGFTPISIFFLENYASLEKPLNHSEALLVIHLMRHKFDKDAPYPGFSTLAKRMGVTPTAVRGYARSLEKKGYLRRQTRTSQTNLFHLEGLFAVLEQHYRDHPPKRKQESLLPWEEEP